MDDSERAQQPGRLLRDYPDRTTLPWLHLLLETLHEIGRAADEGALGRAVTTRLRDLFGPIPSTVLIEHDGGWRLLPSANPPTLPEFIPRATRLRTHYSPGEIVLVEEIPTLVARYPQLTLMHAHGIGALLAAAFGPHEHTVGYVGFYTPDQQIEFSDDELTLLAIIVNAVGIAIDRFRPSGCGA